MYRQDLDDLIIPHFDLSPGSVLIFSGYEIRKKRKKIFHDPKCWVTLTVFNQNPGPQKGGKFISLSGNITSPVQTCELVSDATR